MKLGHAICSLRMYCSISPLSPIYFGLSQSRLSHKTAWINTIAIATSLGNNLLSMELSFLSSVIPTHRFSSPKLIKQFHHSNNYQIKSNDRVVLDSHQLPLTARILQHDVNNKKID